MPKRKARMVRFALVALGVSVACNGSPTDPDPGPGPVYDPVLPTAWAASVTNPYFPLVPGTIWEYTGETEDGTETIVVEVLDEIRIVNGVEATVVHDEVFLDGELIEDTFDWYAQDLAGNVWYLGEETEELEDGMVVSTEGSWEWGVDGALPGIYMWANPGAHLGEEYRQEYYQGEAEDWATVIALSQMVDVPFESFDECIQTEDWNDLEGRSQTLEHKYYCPGVGLALEVPVDAPDEPIELVNLTVP